MVIQEAPKLLPSYEHTKCTAMYQIIPSNRNPETVINGVNEKTLTQKQVGKAEIYTCPNPSPSTMPYNWEGAPNLQLFPEV